MKDMKKVFLIVFCILLCGLTGCKDKQENNNGNLAENYEWLPSAKKRQ